MNAFLVLEKGKKNIFKNFEFLFNSQFLASDANLALFFLKRL